MYSEMYSVFLLVLYDLGTTRVRSFNCFAVSSNPTRITLNRENLVNLSHRSYSCSASPSEQTPVIIAAIETHRVKNILCMIWGNVFHS